jgi:type VI secretion system protein ImpG
MDRRLLHHYERELRFVRELGAEFARHFPKVAGRLGITDLECADPHVERLFESFAFMAAGVSQRLDAEFPRFTEGLMAAAYPHYLGPTPSMAVVQFTPSAQQGALGQGYVVPRDTVLRSRNNQRGMAACEYRTAHAVELWPLRIDSIEYTSVLRDIADLRLPAREPVNALLRLRLRTTHTRPFSRLGLRTLPLYVRGADDTSARLYETLIANTSTVIMRWGPNPTQHVAFCHGPRPVRPLGFDDEHALLPNVSRAFRGHRLLQEYFAFPNRFRFVEFSGLESGMARCQSEQLELIVPLTRHDPALQGMIENERVLPFATPAINLFPRTCDRLPIEDGGQRLPIVPDRARPLDYEVHSVTRVAAFTQGSAQEHELQPQGAMSGRVERDGSRAHYALERRPRMITFEEQRLGPRSVYAGSELLLHLVEGAGALGPSSPQLGVEALCTNRDLPLLLSIGRGDNDFTLECGAPVEATRCVDGPSAPRSNLTDGDSAWRLLNQLSHNALSLGGQPEGAQVLREMLKLCAQLGDPHLQRQIEGVRSVKTTPVIRPMPGPAPQTFVRGLEVQLECEDQAFSANGVFTLACVLSEFFAKQASIHSFTETVLKTRERGEVYRWPAVAGLRPTL